jgi:hypothetical protein
MMKFLTKTHSVQFENVQTPFWTCFSHYIKGYSFPHEITTFLQKNAQCLVCTKNYLANIYVKKSLICF